MTTDPSRKSRIEHTDPLPGAGNEPPKRWADPYLSDRTGKWTVFTRRPLTYRETEAGLKSFVAETTLDALRKAMATEDEKSAAFSTTPDPTQTWTRRP